MSSNSEVVHQRDNSNSDEYHWTPVQRLCIHIGSGWESQEDNQEKIIDESNGVRKGAHSSQIPARYVYAIFTCRSGPQSACVGESVRGIKSDELAGDDCIESNGGAEIDASKCNRDGAGDVDGVPRWVC